MIIRFTYYLGYKQSGLLTATVNTGHRTLFVDARTKRVVTEFIGL